MITSESSNPPNAEGRLSVESSLLELQRPHALRSIHEVVDQCREGDYALSWVALMHADNYRFTDTELPVPYEVLEAYDFARRRETVRTVLQRVAANPSRGLGNLSGDEDRVRHCLQAYRIVPADLGLETADIEILEQSDRPMHPRRTRPLRAGQLPEQHLSAALARIQETLMPENQPVTAEFERVYALSDAA